MAFAFGVLASLGANIASAQPTIGARIVAAVPAAALLLTVEVLSRVGRPMTVASQATAVPAVLPTAGRSPDAAAPAVVEAAAPVAATVHGRPRPGVAGTAAVADEMAAKVAAIMAERPTATADDIASVIGRRGPRAGTWPQRVKGAPPMPWREQRADLVYAPPSYPGHDYRGEGEIVTVRLGDEVVGHLTRKGWAGIGWLARPDLSDDAHIVRHIVEDTLREFAREGRPMVEAWAEVLRYTTHDAPVMAPLDGFRHPLAAG